MATTKTKFNAIVTGQIQYSNNNKIYKYNIVTIIKYR